MKNEAKLSDLWPEIRDRGAAALRPRLAERVLRRAAAVRDDLNPRIAWAVGLSTAFACLALTLAISQWTAHRQSEKAIEQWSAFSLGDSMPDQET